MKRTILAVLMVVMIATPCIAQEVETDGLFSIGGTRWESLPIQFQILPFPWICLGENCSEFNIGFWDGKVYPDDNFRESSFYADMLAVSIFMYDNSGGPAIDIYFGIIQPIGIGMMMRFTLINLYGIWPHLSIIPLIKTDDNWKAAEFSSISPNQGEQGTTLTDVRLYANNTTFQDNPPVQISFDPLDGLNVSNINVISNTEIEFDLDIQNHAQIGLTNVSVQYDNFYRIVTGIDAFEVLPKTN